MEFELEELYVALQSDDSQVLGQFLNTGLQLDMKIQDPNHVLPPFLQNEPSLLSAAAYYCARNCFKLVAERYQNFFITDNAGVPLTDFAILGGDCDIIDLLKGFGLEFEKSLPFAAKNKKDTAFRFICQIQDKQFDIDIFDADKNRLPPTLNYLSDDFDYHAELKQNRHSVSLVRLFLDYEQE